MPRNDEKEVYCVAVDDSLVDLVDTWRYGEKEGGFQRRLNENVLGKIIAAAHRGEAIPPIILAKVDTRFRLLDGQHRLEAWKQEKFPLFAQINVMRPQKVVESFCTINGSARKVSLIHQLNVDTHAYTQKVRVMAMNFDLEPIAIHTICKQLTGQRQGRQLSVGKEQWDFISQFLTAWKGHKKWSDNNSIYAKTGTMAMAMRMCKQAKDPMVMLGLIQNLNFGVDGPLGERYGATEGHVKTMADFCLQSMMRKGML